MDLLLIAIAIQLASGVAVDVTPPDVRVVRPATLDDRTVVARVHDHKSPSHEFDWTRIQIELTTPGTSTPIPMEWRGEYLWAVPLGAGLAVATTYHVCAQDPAGNQACSSVKTLGQGGGSPDGGTSGDDAGGGGKGWWTCESS